MVTTHTAPLREKITDIVQQAIRENNSLWATEKILTLLGPLTAVRDELTRAYAKHGGQQWGRHEFYGILKEEVDELWDAIKADEPFSRVRDEAIQVAAMPVRYLETGDRYWWQ